MLVHFLGPAGSVRGFRDLEFSLRNTGTQARRLVRSAPEEAALGIEIREANLSVATDAEGLLNVLDDYASGEMGGGIPLSPDVRARLIDELARQPQALLLVACDGPQIVGAATCFYGFSTFAARPLLNVHDLAVLPSHQRRGIGRALLHEAERHAAKRGCVKVTLEVRADNARARALYGAFGFGDFELAGARHSTLFLVKPLASG
jgi:ribosomal protein S18 acetylase RimI-like enzyme